MSILLGVENQNKFWKHMCKECIVRVCDDESYKNRQEILKKIEIEVLNGVYTPKPIHGFISSHKGNGVARFIPVFSFEDYAVYFRCVKAFDDHLAALAIEDTFGGWSLGGKRRKIEESHAKNAFQSMQSNSSQEENLAQEYIPISAFNRSAWIKNWQNYWKLLANAFEHTNDDTCFVLFDIANFYDTIDLPKLERQLRKECGNKELVIEVLFYLLSVWNKKQTQYARTTKGLPQDMIGDCSRVLANFYLTTFDKAIKEKAIRENSRYIRYADDMTLICPNKRQAQELIFYASSELHKLGLNINTSKVKFFEKKSFGMYWGFEILDNLETEDTLLKGLTMLKKSWGEDSYFRKEMALKRAITKLSKYTESDLTKWKIWAHDLALTDENLILRLEDHQLTSLINLSSNLKKTIFDLSEIILTRSFSASKLYLLRCLKKLEKEETNYKSINLITAQISKIDDEIIQFALKNSPTNIQKNKKVQPENMDKVKNDSGKIEACDV